MMMMTTATNNRRPARTRNRIRSSSDTANDDSTKFLSVVGVKKEFPFIELLTNEQTPPASIFRRPKSEGDFPKDLEDKDSSAEDQVHTRTRRKKSDLAKYRKELRKKMLEEKRRKCEWKNSNSKMSP